MRNTMDPLRIEEESFKIIDGLVGDEARKRFSDLEWEVVRRTIHTTGDPEFYRLMQFSQGVLPLGVGALRGGCMVFADTNMLMAGIGTGRLDRLGVMARCLVAEPHTRDLAETRSITRAAASIDRVFEDPELAGKIRVFAIGNAPTALFRLLHWLKRSDKKTGVVVIGTPVGFVGAAESKDALMASGIPYITCTGTRGGSAVAASILNQLAIIALRDGECA